jgi:hypothetical protein
LVSEVQVDDAEKRDHRGWIMLFARRFVIGYWATYFSLKVWFCGRVHGVALVQSAAQKEKNNTNDNF